MPWRTRYSPIGLDIGSGQIKMAQLKGLGPACAVHETVVIPLAAAAGDDPADGAHAAIVRSLRSTLERANFVGKTVVSTLPCTEVDIRTVWVPHLAEEPEQLDVLQEQVTSYLAYPFEEAVMDTIDLGEEGDEDNRRRQLLVVTTQRQWVDRRLQMLQEVGLRCTALDVLPLAISRLLLWSQRISTANPLLVVNIGGLTSTAFVLWQGVLTYSRTLSWGSDGLTQALETELGLSPERAERLKRQHGINPQTTGWPAVDREKRRVDMQAMAGVVYEIVRPQLVVLIQELERILSYWGTQSHGAIIEHMQISGGGAMLQNLDRFLQQRLGIDVTLAEPILTSRSTGIETKPSSSPTLNPALTPALGLALRGQPRHG